jgi:hypothetical protein
VFFKTSQLDHGGFAYIWYPLLVTKSASYFTFKHKSCGFWATGQEFGSSRV